MKTATLPDHVVSDALAILLTHLQMPNEEESESYQSNFEAGEQSNPLLQLRLQDIRIESAMVAFTDMVKHRLATLRREQNQFSPIYRLPTEILAHIFQESVVGVSANKKTYDIVVALTRISSHWRNVAVSTPQLWTHIDSRYCEALVTASISRSRNMPLHLYIAQQKARSVFRPELFLKLTLPHRSRWESVIWASHNFQHLSQLYLEDITLPLLQKFEVWSHETMAPVPKSISHHAPLLRSLIIPRCSFPVDAPAFSSLRTVNLRAAVDSKPLSSAQWHSFLGSSPELEDIYAQGDSRDYGAPMTPFQVSLPRLRQLVLKQIYSSVIRALLSAISLSGNGLPSITIVSPLREGDEDDNGHMLETIFTQSNFNATLQASIRQMTSITARCSVPGYTPFLSIDAEAESQPHLLRYNSAERGLDMFRTLVSFNILPNLKIIKLNGSEFFHDGTFSSTLHLCTSLEQLSIQNPDRAGQSERLLDICLRLATINSSSPDSNPSLKWPCPNLKYLGILITGMDFSPVAGLIQTRYGCYGASNIADNNVVRLEELRLSSWKFPKDPADMDDPDSIARIREVLDPLGTVVRRVHREYFIEVDRSPKYCYRFPDVPDGSEG